MIHDQDRLCIELKRLEWARQLTEEAIQDIASAAELMEFQAGQTVIELESEVNHVYFVIIGRLEGALFDRLGKELLRDFFGRGSVAGLFSLLLTDRSHLQVEAVEPTAVIRLSLDELLRLSAKHREFQLAMFRISANIVKRLVMVDRELPKPAVVVIVHHSQASRPLAQQLAGRLQELGEFPCVAGDDERFRAAEGIPFKLLFEQGTYIGPEATAQLLKEWSAHGRLLIDVRADHSRENLTRMTSYADVVLWCVQPQDVAAAVQTLKALEQSSPRLREKIRIVWCLNYDDWLASLFLGACRVGDHGDFKTFNGQPKPNQGKLLQQGCDADHLQIRCGIWVKSACRGWTARGRHGLISACSRPSKNTASTFDKDRLNSKP